MLNIKMTPVWPTIAWYCRSMEPDTQGTSNEHCVGCDWKEFRSVITRKATILKVCYSEGLLIPSGTLTLRQTKSLNLTVWIIPSITLEIKVKDEYSSLWESISELPGVTCHMISHSVTCHPTQANMPHLNPSQTGWYSIYLSRRDGRLSRSR